CDVHRAGAWMDGDAVGPFDGEVADQLTVSFVDDEKAVVGGVGDDEMPLAVGRETARRAAEMGVVVAGLRRITEEGLGVGSRGERHPVDGGISAVAVRR